MRERDSYIGMTKRYCTLDRSHTPNFKPMACLGSMTKGQELLLRNINNTYSYIQPFKLNVARCVLITLQPQPNLHEPKEWCACCSRSGVTISSCPPHQPCLRNVDSKFTSNLLIIGASLLAITCKQIENTLRRQISCCAQEL